jgi:hypothetical protein
MERARTDESEVDLDDTRFGYLPTRREPRLKAICKPYFLPSARRTRPMSALSSTMRKFVAPFAEDVAATSQGLHRARRIAQPFDLPPWRR